jgi:hypothetical protein
MFPLRPVLDRFWRGRIASSPFLKRFRSAVQLPLLTLRKVQLRAPAVSKSRFSHLPPVFARAALILLPAVLLVTFLETRHSRLHSANSTESLPASSLAANWESSLALSSAALTQRPVFPYSIVPGGVRNAHELQTAAAGDPVVAQHYSDFRITQARTLRLERPLAMYVSYRREDRVFWTKNRMLIPAGETLISDGENLARVRCANRLSRFAVLPIAATEPSSEELSEPVFVPPLMAQLLPGESNGPPLLAAPPPPGPSTGSDTPPPPPLFPPLLPPGAPPVIPLIPVVPPPISTPEPSSIILLMAGAALISLFASLALRRNSLL